MQDGKLRHPSFKGVRDMEGPTESMKSRPGEVQSLAIVAREDNLASHRSSPSAHIFSQPPTTKRRSLESGKLAVNLVTRALRSSCAYNRHDLHSTATIWPLKDRSVATSGSPSVAPDDSDVPRYREREFNTLRFRAKFLSPKKILCAPRGALPS